MNTIYGIDTSHWEPGVNWATVQKTHPFGMTKASEGLTGTDSLFHPYWRQMKAAGLVRGAYHFFHPNQDAIAQAKHFLSIVGDLEIGDMPYILDLEVTGGMPNGVIAGGAMDFLNYVQSKTPGGTLPILYASPSFLSEHGVLRAFSKFPLWVANYGVSKPKIPSAWTDWAIWQYSDKGRVAGVPQACDVNEFKGTLEELKQLLCVRG